MPMISNDLMTNRDEIRARMQQALRENNSDGFSIAFDDMLANIAQGVRAEYDQQISELRQSFDGGVLSARGAHQLTTEERSYYQRLGEAMRSSDPKQALSNGNLIMPETVINSVMDDLRTQHPLLSVIDFVPTGGAIKWLMNTNSRQEAQWGKLCDDIVKELLGGFKEVDSQLLKLSAFLPVCKALLDLGPEWLDSYVRQVLTEALANGLEAGIVTGDGNDKPIGMTRQVGDNVVVTGGVYPEKTAVAITDLSAETVGNLLAGLAVDDNGNSRVVDNVILVVNPTDYLQKVFPATTLMAPDGTYRRDVLPYPMTVIQSHALTSGKAVLGLAKRYFAAVGTAKDGKIEYSDHYHFLEDDRVYLIKAYANGQPKDNHAFTVLDISGLKPAVYKVELVDSSASDETDEAEAG